MIDALGTGLNAAVADACRDGARAVVREVLMELISNPDLMAAVRPTPVTTVTPDESPRPAAPSFWNRAKANARSAGRAVTGAARTLAQTVQQAVKPAADALRLKDSSADHRSVEARSVAASVQAMRK